MVPGLIILLESSHVIPSEPLIIVAVATSLATIILTSLSAAYAQIKAQRVNWTVARRFAPALVVGSALAPLVAINLSEGLLRLTVGLFFFVIAVIILIQWKPGATRELPGRLASVVIALIAGLISGIAGIGGGNVIVPTLIYFNVAVHRATATASALGLPLALAGTLSYIIRGYGQTSNDGMIGYVYLPAWVAMSITATVMAPVGVRLAQKVSPQKMRQFFACLLIVVTLRLLWPVLFPSGA